MKRLLFLFVMLADLNAGAQTFSKIATDSPLLGDWWCSNDSDPMFCGVAHNFIGFYDGDKPSVIAEYDDEELGLMGTTDFVAETNGTTIVGKSIVSEEDLCTEIKFNYRYDKATDLLYITYDNKEYTFKRYTD